MTNPPDIAMDIVVDGFETVGDSHSRARRVTGETIPCVNDRKRVVDVLFPRIEMTFEDPKIILKQIVVSPNQCPRWTGLTESTPRYYRSGSEQSLVACGRSSTND